MNLAYLAAALLLVLLGLAHSLLGERFILVRLFRRGGLPRLFGGETFTRHTLRFAWHLTTVLLCGLAALVAMLARPGREAEASRFVPALSLMLLVCALVAGLGSRGRHFSWAVFLAATLLLWLG